ncbi:MAG: 4-alpha-glucanotransferase [Candidatus Nanopelagicales bacterium]
MTVVSEELLALAQECGVATDYWDWQGRHIEVEQSTIVAVLAALGYDANSPAAIARARENVRLQRWRRPLPPCSVVPAGTDSTVWVHVPHGQPVGVLVECEDGSIVQLPQIERWVPPTEVDGALVGEAAFALPDSLPLGWHRLVASIGSRGTARTRAVAPLVVVPGRLASRLDVEEAPATGLMVQLYASRSRRSWGYGDLADLRALVGWAGRDLGLDFVLLNPLHAPRWTEPLEPSPYLPTTRRFPNLMYLSLDDIPEIDDLDDVARGRFDEHAKAGRALNASELLEVDAVWACKRSALELLAQARLRPDREAAYDAFVAREGRALDDFAGWCSAQDGPAREVVRRGQWWLDEQLARVEQTCRDVGMALGLVHDLAVGVQADGFDATQHKDVLASGVTVGAPPDAYNQLGQDWQQPPFHPGRLAESGYAVYRDMLRTVLRHAAGVRIDHVIGLFRLWWIPEGTPPAAGTYVRCDHEALVGILLLEAQRAAVGRGAVVIGEDLGTVEPWVRDLLRDRGVLGTSVLWFEREWPGKPLAPERWRRLCLASVTTHDLPPTMGYLRGAHVDVRADLGLLERDHAVERAEFDQERREWVGLLRERGLLTADDDDSVLVALHAYLAQTPAQMRAVALSDLVGALRPVNQPGTHREYPNWLVPLADESGRPVLVDDLVLGRVATERVRRLLAALGTVSP